jgi:hypothetical protein
VPRFRTCGAIHPFHICPLFMPKDINILVVIIAFESLLDIHRIAGITSILS